MNKAMRIKQTAVVVKGPPADPSQFSQPVQEMLTAETPEQLQEVIEKHQGLQVTQQEAVAVKKHGVSVHLKTCYGAECQGDREVTPEDIRLAISECAERHANAMDDIFEEVADEPAEGAGGAEAPAEGE